jgi:diamine N-acetyltransferase
VCGGFLVLIAAAWMSTSDFSLRMACGDDAVTIAALAVQVFLDTYATEGIRPDLAREAFSEYGVHAFAARLAEPGRSFVLVEKDDGLLGFTEVVLSALPSPAGRGAGAQLVRLYVHPAAQRLGLGRALLMRAEQLVQAAKLTSLWLTAWDGNHKARAFYAHAGYEDVGATTYSFQSHTYANRVFAKPLEVDGREVAAHV